MQVYFGKKMRGKGWRVEKRGVQEFLTLVYHSLSSCFSFCGTAQTVALSEGNELYSSQAEH